MAASPSDVEVGGLPSKPHMGPGKILVSDFPPEVRPLLVELAIDTDGSNYLEVSEIAHALVMLKESKRSVRRMRNLVIAMVVIVAVLVASIFGVSYAAADLAAKVKTSGGTLTDASGNPVRTSGATISASSAFARTSTSDSITTARAGSRLLFEEASQLARSGKASPAFSAGNVAQVSLHATENYKFGARRLYNEVEMSDAGARNLAGAFGENTTMATEPAQLVELGIMPGSLADELCRLVEQNHFEAYLKGFTPVPGSGASGFMATIDPSTVKGCTTSSRASYGFSADFSGKLYSYQSAPSTFHVDCLSPVSSSSVCTISQQIIKIVPPSVQSIIQASDSDAATNAILAVIPEANWNASRLLETAEGRELQSIYGGKAYSTVFPPPPVSLSDEFYPSPVLATYRTNRPPGVTNPKALVLGTAVHNFYSATAFRYANNATWLSNMRFNPSATPYNNALLACSSSWLCLAGWENYVYRVFKQEYYIGGVDGLARRLSAAFSALPRTTIVDATAIDAAVKQFTYTLTDLATASRLQGQTATVVWGNCPAGQIPRFTGLTDPSNWYTCVQWNVNDINVGARQIAASCINAFEVLEWYFTWWKLYRIAEYPTTFIPQGASWVNPGVAAYRYDYCTYSGAWWKTNYAIGSWFNPTDPVTLSTNYGGYSLNTICNGGRAVPHCQMPKFVLRWT